MTAIIREDPEPLPATVPAPLRWLIERLLSKEPSERYDSTRDLYRELRQIRERFSEATSAQQIPVAEAVPRRSPIKARRVVAMIGLPALALAAGVTLTARLMPPPQTDLASYKFTAIARDEAQERYPAFSPDGRSIAYNVSVYGIRQVFVKAIGSPDTTQLTHARADCSAPVWSPDGATIYYASGGGVWAIGASGGTPELVLEKAARRIVHPDGKTFAFVRDGKVWIGPIQGGSPREFWQPPHQDVRRMEFSPDGSKLAVLDATDLWIVPYPSGTPRNFGVVSVYGAAWFPDSRHVLIGGEAGDTLEALDSADGSRRVIYRSTESFLDWAVSPDGKKIAYAGGSVEFDVLQVALPEGRIQTTLGGGGFAMWPDWAPSGTHYLVTIARGGPENLVVEDRSTSDGFARRVAEVPAGSTGRVTAARWAPDGTRFVFILVEGAKEQLMIANASGGRWTPIAVTAKFRNAHAWSPDGQWIAFVRLEGGKQQLVKVRPVAGSAPEALANAAPAITTYEAIQWSPTGDGILYTGADGMVMISPDGATIHKLTGRKFMAYGFTRDGTQVYGIFRNTSGAGAQWQLYSVDVKSGVEKVLAPLDLPASTDELDGFSLHPDGKRFLTSIAKWPFDIWMLEGFDQPRPKTWLERLLRR